MKFGVVFLDAFAFFEGTAGGAYAKTEIPQSAGEIRDKRAEFGFGFFIAEKKKNIEIRVGEKETAAITTEGDEAEALRLRVVDAQNFAEDLLSHAIGEITKREKRFLRASARFKILPDALSFVLGLRAKDGQGS